MADSDLSLLFRLRAQNQASPAIHSVQADVQKLRTTFGGDLAKMQQVSTVALGQITSSLTNVSAQVPVLGSAVNALSGQMAGLASVTGQATTGVAAMAGPIGIAVAGMVATAVVVEQLGTALFALAKQTADYQGKLFDLSQQTGVAVETLSALEIAATDTGGSIETASQATVAFQKSMAESSDENSKAAKTFKQLNVEVTDTEDTLRQTFLALAKMPEGYRQTAAAQELFGRGGKQVLAIIKETNGDLDLLIDRLRDAGLVTTEQAKAADEFNDTLNALGFQARGLGTEIIPDATDALKDLNKFLKDNKEGANALRLGLGFLANTFIGPFKGALLVAQTNIKGVTDALEFLGIVAAKPIVVGVEVKAKDSSGLDLLRELKAAGAGRPIEPEKPSDDLLRSSGLLKASAADAAKAQSEAIARAARSIAIQQAEIEEQARANRVALERERDLDIKNIDQWEQESLRALAEHKTAQEKIFDEEEANIRRFVKNRADQIQALTELEQKRTKLINQTVEEQNRINDEAQRQRDQSALRLEEQLTAIRDAAREGEERRIQDSLDRRAITESEALSRQLELLKQAQADRLTLIDVELQQISTSAKRKIELDNEKIKSEQRFTDEFKRLSQERIEAMQREDAERAPGQEGVPEPKDPIPDLGPPPEMEEGFRGLQSALDDLGKSIGDLLGASADFGRDFGDVIGGAINDLAFGIGSLVEQWVLLGETGPAALRKLLAATLAHLAAEAAVKATFQLAEAFAALFYNPAAAAAHFTSAAIFGSIAGVAAVAGRSVAGDLFKPQPGQKATTGSGAQPIQTITQGRNQREEVHVFLHSDLGELSRVITTTVVKNYRNGGEIREVIATDGGPVN